jgi:hypothetical protein
MMKDGFTLTKDWEMTEEAQNKVPFKDTREPVIVEMLEVVFAILPAREELSDNCRTSQLKADVAVNWTAVELKIHKEPLTLRKSLPNKVEENALSWANIHTAYREGGATSREELRITHTARPLSSIPNNCTVELNSEAEVVMVRSESDVVATLDEEESSTFNKTAAVLVLINIDAFNNNMVACNDPFLPCTTFELSNEKFPHPVMEPFNDATAAFTVTKAAEVTVTDDPTSVVIPQSKEGQQRKPMDVPANAVIDELLKMTAVPFRKSTSTVANTDALKILSCKESKVMLPLTSIEP